MCRAVSGHYQFIIKYISCVYPATKLDTGLNTGHKLGYLRKSPSTGSVQIFRCNNNGNHYISGRSDCEIGITPEVSGVYALSRAQNPVSSIPSGPINNSPTPVPSPGNCTSYYPDLVNTVKANPYAPLPNVDKKHGTQSNTGYPGYYKSTLPARTLGPFINTVKTKAVWNNICSDEKALTLYWENKKLKDISGKIFDDLSLHYSEPLGLHRVLITPTHENSIPGGYPGCAGYRDLGANPRLCGEYNAADLESSEVISVRWYRPHNIDLQNDPLYKKFSGQKSQIQKDANIGISINRIMKYRATSLTGQDMSFEISLSKVPGDFSELACKPNTPIRYSSGHSVTVSEKGFKSFLPKECQIDSNEIQHYYFNVRAVTLDKANKEIIKSICYTGSGCKFEVEATTLFTPSKYDSLGQIIPVPRLTPLKVSDSRYSFVEQVFNFDL